MSYILTMFSSVILTICLANFHLVHFHPPLYTQLMCLVTVPIMAFSFYMILQSGAGNDGILGKEAYEAAANIADETLSSSMPTIESFGGETKAAKRYEGHLGEAEDSAIRQVRGWSVLTF